jgi:hypothetical protein
VLSCRCWGITGRKHTTFRTQRKFEINNILHLFIIKDTPVTKSHCLVFVYGATGAGKTFTMLGSKASPGITFLTIMELYRQMDTLTSEREFELAVSHLEVSHYLLTYRLCRGKSLIS